jgi:hypothetical protein
MTASDDRQALRAGKVSLVRAAAALVAASGLLLQCYLSLARSVSEGQTVWQGLVMFFGYFTILTNLLVNLALAIPLVVPRSKPAKFLTEPFVVAGIAASILFVSLAYHVLLRGLWNPQGVHLLADDILHYVTPALFLLYWFAYMRGSVLNWHDPLVWGIYPTAYFIYVLLRGEIIGSYPYGFIDVTSIGYAKTLVNAIGLLVIFVILGLALVGVDRVGRRFAP